MKKSVLFVLIVILMFPGISSVHGQAMKSKHKHVIDLSQLNVNDYMQDRFYVKLKPEFKGIFNSPDLRVENFNKANAQRRIRPLAPSRSSGTRSARLGKAPTIDLDLYHQVIIGPDDDLQSVMDELAALNIAEYIEPVNIPRMDKIPNDPRLDGQYYLNTIKAFDAWDISEGSEEVLLAIVDSGVELDHEDLADRIYYNEDEIPNNGIDDDGDGYIDNYAGWDFCGADIDNPKQDGDPNLVTGDHSHGLEVAGCAVATSDNGIGIAGVAPRTKILVTKHTYDNQEEDDDGIYFAYSGLIYAAEMGADIINCSWGGGAYSQIGQDIITYATIDMGALIVASAGNSDDDEPHYPSSYRYALSVAWTDKDNQKAATYGTSVDICAPGSAILTTTFNDRYVSVQGSSFSSPIVAGGAALVKALYPEFSAMQLGEMVRVTANPDLYDNNPGFEGLLGKGILDAHAALTIQSPSVRLQTVKIENDQGGAPQAGDDALIKANFINYLFASSSSARVLISTESEFVDVDRSANLFQLGIMNTMGEASNELSPFKIKIDENVPENTLVEFKLSYLDGGYEDVEFFTILINPTYINITENLVATTMTAKGRVGYNTDGPGEGLGFVSDETDMLFEMGLMIGSSAEKLVNTLRPASTEAGAAYDDDFVPVSKISQTFPGEGLRSYSEISGTFDDSGAGAKRLELEVDYTSLVWKDNGHEKYVIFEYHIKNNGVEELDSLYVGMFADWDIIGPDDVVIDKAEWYGQDGINMGYVRSKFDQAPIAGIQLLTGTPNYFAIQNDESWPGNPWGLYDGFTDEEKFQSLSSGTDTYTESGNLDSTRSDVSHVVSNGPFKLLANDSIIIAFAVHGTSDFAELVQSAHNADERYNQTLQAPVPVVEDQTICYGDSTEIIASGEPQSFNWYSDRFEGLPFATDTDRIITPRLFADTILYVSNADAEYESVRVPVSITISAIPKITSQGGITSICPGDTATLTANEADSYLWMLPDNSNLRTRSIRAHLAGNYSLQVTSSDPACTSGSDPFVLLQAPQPESGFAVDKDMVSLCKEEVITFTFDGSMDAETFSWDFDDGNSAGGQVVQHTYGSAGSFIVSLEVSNQSGCRDIALDTIDVEDDVPEADFSYQLVTNSDPFNYSFSDKSVNTDTWKWEFGNGSNSTDRDPTHRFADEGTYAVSLVASNQLGCEDSTGQEIVVIITGIEGEIEAGLLKVYPNPTRDIITISFDESEVSKNSFEVYIHDSKGALIRHQNIENGSNVIKVDNLASGVYMIDLLSEGKLYQFKFIKR